MNFQPETFLTWHSATGAPRTSSRIRFSLFRFFPALKINLKFIHLCRYALSSQRKYREHARIGDKERKRVAKGRSYTFCLPTTGTKKKQGDWSNHLLKYPTWMNKWFEKRTHRARAPLLSLPAFGFKFNLMTAAMPFVRARRTMGFIQIWNVKCHESSPFLLDKMVLYESFLSRNNLYLWWRLERFYFPHYLIYFIPLFCTWRLNYSWMF